MRISLHEQFNRCWLPAGDCWEWQGALGVGGYGRLTGPDGKWWQAHRLSYFLHCGELEEGKVIRHACDNPKCVNPKHLLQGTQKQNSVDAIERGLWNPNHGHYDRFRGEKHPNAVLTDKETRYIRRVFVPRHRKYSASALAKKFKCSASTILRKVNE